MPDPSEQNKGGFYTRASSGYSPNTSERHSQFDFILQEQEKNKNKPLNFLSNIPKPFLVAISSLIGLILVIILFSFISTGDKANNQKLIDLMAQSREIVRVTDAFKSKFRTSSTTNIAATTDVALTSSKARMANYLTLNKIKYSPLSLNAHLSKTTDSKLTTAAQNNNLDDAYLSYLKGALLKYQASISDTYKTSTPVMKKILTDAYNSAKTLLASQQLNSLSSS